MKHVNLSSRWFYLSVCNGIGRILTGAMFDSIGRRKTMISANILTICAASVTLIAVSIGSLPLCIAGLCLTGLSYGTDDIYCYGRFSHSYCIK